MSKNIKARRADRHLVRLTSEVYQKLLRIRHEHRCETRSSAVAVAISALDADE
jgi:hypothetical protein